MPQRRHEEEETRNKVKVEVASPVKVVKPQCLLEGDDQNITLTVKDVFARLGIKRFGEEVMAFFGIHVDERIGRKKEELMSDDKEVPDAQPITESA